MPINKPGVDFNSMDEPSDYLPALNELAQAVDLMVDAANQNEQASLDALAIKQQVEQLKSETSAIKSATQNILYLTEQVKNSTQRISVEGLNYKPAENGYEVVNGDRLVLNVAESSLSLIDFAQFKEAGHWFVVANDSDGVVYIPPIEGTKLKASRAWIEYPQKFVISSGNEYLFRVTESGYIKITATS